MPRFARLYGRLVLSNTLLLTDLERGHPKEPHYYLGFIGTAPEHQGQGAATALISPMVERADREGVGVAPAQNEPNRAAKLPKTKD